MIFVRVGSTRHDCGGQRINLKQMIMHDKYNYNPQGSDYDYGLLELATPLSFTDKIQPIALADEDTVDLTDIEALATGWGESDMNSSLTILFLFVFQKIRIFFSQYH